MGQYPIHLNVVLQKHTFFSWFLTTVAYEYISLTNHIWGSFSWSPTVTVHVVGHDGGKSLFTFLNTVLLLHPKGSTAFIDLYLSLSVIHFDHSSWQQPVLQAHVYLPCSTWKKVALIWGCAVSNSLISDTNFLRRDCRLEIVECTSFIIIPPIRKPQYFTLGIESE